MPGTAVTEAFQRLTSSAERPDLAAATAAIHAVAETAVAEAAVAETAVAETAVAETAVAETAVAETAVAETREAPGASPTELLDALVLLRWAQAELAAAEPKLIAAARAAGVPWQVLAPALGVASRQAAERRYLRILPAATDQPGDTRDGRVRAERDRRAGRRAVAQWANDNTADLRRLAGQITALTDLDDDASVDVDRLHHALADVDASALPGLLADTHRHLARHPRLAGQVEAVTARTIQVRRLTQQRRSDAHDGPDAPR